MPTDGAKYSDIWEQLEEDAGAKNEASSRLYEDLLLQRPIEERITSVTYPWGKSRQFGYDEYGELNSVTQPDGTVWKLAQPNMWVSDRNKVFHGQLEVSADGTYTSTDSNGTIRVYKPDGTKTIDGFDVFQLQGALRTPERVSSVINDNFDKIDLDGNLRLTKEELTSATKDQSLSADARLASMALKSGYVTFKEMQQDRLINGAGISRDDIDIYLNASKFEEPSKWSPMRPGTGMRLGLLIPEVAGIIGLAQAVCARFGPPAGRMAARVGLGAVAGLNYYFARETVANRELIDSKARVDSMISDIR